MQGAADALALTQSAATKRLLALERRVGRPLLDRTARGVLVTEAGAVLYPLAREVLAALVSAEAAVTSSSRAVPLVIHASRTIGETLLPQWLASFRVCAPGLRVSVSITNSDEVVHAVRDRTAAIGFIEGPAESMQGLTELVVAHDELRVVVASEHPWARRRAIPIKALATQPYLAREVGSGTREVAAAAMAAKGVELTPRSSSQARRVSSARYSPEVSPCFPSAWSNPRSRPEHFMRFPCRASSFVAPCAPYVAGGLRCTDRLEACGPGLSG